VPAAPTSFTAVAAGGGFHLTWRDASNNELEFVVERRTGTGAFGEVTRTAANVAEHHDAPVPAGAQLTYRVAASNNAGRSAYTNEVTVMSNGGGSSSSGGVSSSVMAASSAGGSSAGASSSASVSSSGEGSSAGEQSSSVTVASSSTSNSLPTCTINQPAAASVQPFDAMWMFSAAASDVEDGQLTGASVVWTSNLETAPLGTGLSLTSVLSAGVHTITCTASDSAGGQGTDSVTVTSASPVAAIFHPGALDGPRPASSPVPFTGRGRSSVDGTLTGAALVWTSDLDGAIGTGENFSASLTVGTHLITLTATDSTNATATATLTQVITNN